MNLIELDKVKMRKQDKMIAYEAYKRGVKFERVSDKKLKLSHGSHSYIVKNGNIRDSASNPLAIKVVKLKDVTSRLLRSRGYNAIENTVFDHKDLERAWQWAKDILPVVLKPAGGNLGKLVFVNVDNYDDFKKCFEKIAKKHQDILIEKFIDGEEYRFTYINNQIVTINKNVPAHIIGDGKHTIKELVSIKNEERENSTVYKTIKLNSESERVLTQQDYNLDSVPPNNEKVFVRKTSNIARGGEAVDVTDEIDENIKEHVRKAMKSIKGLFLCGADVLISDGVPYIMEINNLPGLLIDDYLEEGKSRDVIQKLVDEMFPDTVKKESHLKKVVDK